MTGRDADAGTPGKTRGRRGSFLPAWAAACCVVAAVTLLAVCNASVNTLFLRQVNYNEGWNLYNMRQWQSGMPYPAHLSWTSNNYPMLSFALLGVLSRMTHAPLLSARAVSLAALALVCFSVGSACDSLGCTRRVCLLAGLFAFALYTLNTTGGFGSALYVGVDDPTLLGLAFACAAVAVYLRGRNAAKVHGSLVLCALLCTLGLSTKLTFLDVPAVVLLDLVLTGRSRRAGWFAAALAVLLGVSFAWQVHAGGSGFLLQLGAPRMY